MAFHQNYSDLREVDFEDVCYPQGFSVAQLAAAAQEMERLPRLSKLGSEDLLYSHVQDKLRVIGELREVNPGSASSLTLFNRILPLRQSRGRQGDWEPDPSSRKNACTVLKDLLSELDERVSRELHAARQCALNSLLRELRKFVLYYAITRRHTDGRAEFHDLLAWTDGLLRNNIEVRDHFRRRFTHLLIDESQDTDPIQAEICILMPRRTGLRQRELALEDSGVPYRLESASLAFEIQEILDLMNCLRAIDNPSDQVAAVSLSKPIIALRSKS